MERSTLLQALDGPDLAPIRLHGEAGTRLDRNTVKQHRAHPAAGRIAAHMRTAQSKVLAQEVYEQEARLDLGAMYTPVDRDLNHLLVRHYASPRAARCSARWTNTRTTSRLYSAEPRISLRGSHASAASRAASRIVGSSSRDPVSASSAAVAARLAAPTAVRPIPAWRTVPPSISSDMATATVAKSPTLRSSLR